MIEGQGRLGYWRAGDAERALDVLARLDRIRVFAAVAGEAVDAARRWREGDTGLGASVQADEFVGRVLQDSLLDAQVRLERGQTLLASVGSTAPFVGLFGTVWGILQAMVGLSAEANATIDRVAGPVGEALVMTAAGLFVAIPAVLAQPMAEIDATPLVDAGGAVAIDGDPVAIEDLAGRLRARADGADADLHLHADRAVRHERVVEVMAAARGAGLNRIAFVTEPGTQRVGPAARR